VTNSAYKTSVPDFTDPYWKLIREWAANLDADGCSGVPDFFLDACLEHDCHYRTHHWLDGAPIFRSEADERFRQVIQSRSVLGVLSPMALWRWAGVRLMGRWAWRGDKI
jgi:hypothetical protein